MHKNRNKKLRKWATDSLYGKWQQGRGRSKHGIKDKHNSTPYIHSDRTYRTYRQQINLFVDYCYNNGIKTPEKALEAVPGYFQKLQADGKSAWTQHTALCAIAKAYGMSTEEIPVKLPERERQAVKRSRYAVQRDAQIDMSAPEVKAQILFCRCTGLRRRELEALTGDKLVKDNGKSFILITNGKGGKTRLAEICGTPEEIRAIEKLMYAAGPCKVFLHVHTKLDVHSFRGEYACRMYRSYARDLHELTRSEKYCCRKDLAGTVYDKKAMGIVSRNLGHNRINVIAESYLYKL